MIRIALAVLCALVAGGLYFCRADERAPDRTLAEARSDYHEEHGTGRIVAEVNARLVARDGGAELLLRASAIGAFVKPMPGFEHLRGTNFQTALELETLILEDAIVIETSELDTNMAARRGELLPVRRGRLPERKMRTDGSIDYDAKSREVPLELAFVTGALPDGDWRSVVRVHDRVRLSVDFTFHDGVGEIRDIRDHFPEDGETIQ